MVCDRPLHARFPVDIGETLLLRNFSSSLSPNDELLQALSDELASEESEYEIDPDFLEITDQIKKSFTIEDHEGLGTVKLVSTFSGGKGGDEEITVY